MKNKNGFTLVELLAVIVITSILLILAVPKIINQIKINKENALEANKEIIMAAARNYVLDYNLEAPVSISLSDLCDLDYIECPINNPVNDTNLNGYINVNEDKIYSYSEDDATYWAHPVLTVNLNGGTTTQTFSTTYLQGTKITLTDPTKASNDFLSWSVTGAGSSISNNVLTIGMSATTITANWDPNLLAITVNPNSGSYNGSTSNTVYNILPGATQYILNPIRSGYLFTGWNKTCSSCMSGSTYTAGTSNDTLTAQWLAYSSLYTYTGNSTFIDEGNNNWIIKFLTSGTLVMNLNGYVDALVVGGGGGGGSHVGGGGGGGGFVYDVSYQIISNNSITVTVGNGGAGGASNNTGTNGGNSAFGSLTAIGGGGGGTYYGSNAAGCPGKNGGSGGGAGGTEGDATCAGGAGTTGQGNNGGNNGIRNGQTDDSGTGGGGAGAPALNMATSYDPTRRDGGAGLSSSILGTVYYFSGGGGSGAYNAVNGGYGGAGGGGGGASTSASIGLGNTQSINAAGNGSVGAGATGGNGATNSGGGGGGGSGGAVGTGGSGGSGIVIIRNTRIEEVGQNTKYYFTYSGNYAIVDKNTDNWKIKFLTSGKFTSLSNMTVDVLIVAGGGGGGAHVGGGGGGGGFIYNTSYSITSNNSITVTVGSGGIGGISDNTGTNGENSIFGTLTAIGGGGGGTYSGTNAAGCPGKNGGSGGGAGGTNGTTTCAGGTGTTGQGNNGGNNGPRSEQVNSSGTGGGGAGAPALNMATSYDPTRRDGGAGLSSSILGTVYYFSGGGGSGAYNAVNGGYGGAGGGGGGASTSASIGIGNTQSINAAGNGTVGVGGVGGNGAINSGGGGGAGSSYGRGGFGGSGIVIIRKHV